jgi:hypothetical protein
MSKQGFGTAQTPTQPAEEMTLVRALVPLWAGWELIEPGTVYEQPVEAARGMAALGLVELVAADGLDEADGSDGLDVSDGEEVG